MRLFLTIAALLFPIPAFADDGLNLSGSTRVRYENIEGQPRVGFNSSDDLLSVRTILTGEYRTGDWRFEAELYDSRAFGSDSGTPLTTADVNAMELVQASIRYEASDAFGPGTKLNVQAGRFTLNLGSRRLIAADDFRNTTNGYTGVRADIGLGDELSTTLVYTLPQVRLPDGGSDLVNNRVKMDRENFDLVLLGGLVAQQLASKRGIVELSFYQLDERDSNTLATRDRSLSTGGIRIYRDPAPGSISYESETIYQFGSVSASFAPAAQKLDVSAWFTHFELGYSFSRAWAPQVSLEFDYASGDGRGAKFGRFDTLFGMRRSDFAPSGLYTAVGRSNLIASGVRLEVTPSKRIDAFVAYRALWLASRYDSFATTGVRDITGSSGRFAGHQVEARLRYWLVPKRLRLEWSGLFLAKGRFLATAPNAPDSGNTLYNALNATLSF
ncbi:alginate export family protein [Sphingorhabdus sp.]|uniref:alginate export family protein n=1 Tax=Sphingorhabdus sp. TaxID=1902408 RepID=UPI0038FC72DB